MNKYFIFFSFLWISKVVASQPNYGTYTLSEKCLHCFEEDFVKKQKTFAQQERECLQEEFQKIKEKFLTTLELVIHSRDTYSQNDNLNEQEKKHFQENSAYLRESSLNFINFIEKFCDDNRQLYGMRGASFVYYYEMMDLLNTRLHHLQNEDLNFFSSLTDQQLDSTFTAIVDGILTSSNKHTELSDQEQQKIDIFLQLSKFLSRPKLHESISTTLLNQLKNLYSQENNLIALALYKKL